MKTAIKSTLKRLINGPRTEKELTTGSAVETSHAGHTIRRLYEAQQQGYCISDGETWMLTQAGRNALAEKKVQKITGRICASSTKEAYDGHELKRLSYRPHAYDAFDLPSRYHFGMVYRKDANV
jgi:hypothetical protein